MNNIAKYMETLLRRNNDLFTKISIKPMYYDTLKISKPKPPNIPKCGHSSVRKSTRNQKIKNHHTHLDPERRMRVVVLPDDLQGGKNT